MCRIVGLWNFGGKCKNLSETIAKMRDTMISGGPDDAGTFIDGNMAFGHRRLAVIDLTSAGHQPMTYRQFTIVFNGEIYNYQEIRRELDDVGFDGHSDTEVLLKAYAKWGRKCVSKLEGMFAFAIWDSSRKELFLCRDRSGVKPLYWYFDGEYFMFASELKALYASSSFRKEIDTNGLAEFLSFGYISAPNTIIANCRKMEPATTLMINEHKEIVVERYWNPKTYYERKSGSFEHRKFSSLLEKSFSSRMVSDVPVGIFLSGGVDSSLVAATLVGMGYRPETFTVGFEENSFDESHYARAVAGHLGLKNTCFRFDAEHADALIRELPYVYDEPFADGSALPTMFLAERTRQHVKVSLSADGADELFGGYDRYGWTLERRQAYKRYGGLGFLLSAVSADFASAALSAVGITMGKDKYLRIKNSLGAKTFLDHYAVDITHFRREDLKSNGLSLEPSYRQYELDNGYESMMLFDFCRYLPEDILTKVDRAASRAGLEARDPFLDRELLEYVFSLRIDDKMPGGEPKGILKQQLVGYLPPELVYRPKKGFGVPLETWFRGRLGFYIDDMIEDELLEEYFDKRYVRNLVNDFRTGRRVDFEKLWYILVFQTWRKTWGI